MYLAHAAPAMTNRMKTTFELNLDDGQQSAGFSLQTVPPLARSLLPAPAERLGYGTETCADQYTEEMRGFGDVLRKSLRNAAVKSSPFLMREREAKILVEK